MLLLWARAAGNKCGHVAFTPGCFPARGSCCLSWPFLDASRWVGGLWNPPSSSGRGGPNLVFGNTWLGVVNSDLRSLLLSRLSTCCLSSAWLLMTWFLPLVGLLLGSWRTRVLLCVPLVVVLWRCWLSSLGSWLPVGSVCHRFSHWLATVGRLLLERRTSSKWKTDAFTEFCTQHMGGQVRTLLKMRTFP